MLDPDIPEQEDEQDEPQLSPQEFLQAVMESDNLVSELSEGQQQEIARQVFDEYKIDKDSMSEWFQRMERGLDLAKLSKGEMKTYPHSKAANIKYPLVTSAALQFNARAYPAIVPADSVVKVRTYGSDPQGMKAARGERVSSHMSWQLQSRIEEWEEDTDKLLTILPVVGTMVRKVWFDPAQGRPRSRLIEAGKFIVNDKVRNLSDAPRCSEEIDLYPSEIRERELSGQFVEVDLEHTDEDKSACHEFIEQHCRIDLDEDGYSEPYIATIYKDKQQLVRLVADFDEDSVTFEMQEAVQMVPVVQPDPRTGQPVQMGMMPQPTQVPGKILSIRRRSYFAPYHFLPSVDGGFHGTGLGFLLGDISEAINTIINMMIDAGHYSMMGGGFIGSEFRLKGGRKTFEPGEWKLAQSTGGDVRSAVVPMDFAGPDAVLFQMLGLLIDAGREIASVKDIMTGEEPRQAQTATTTLAQIEQGMMVFTAAYKRIFRALKGEYKILAGINSRTVSPEEYNTFHDEIDEQGQPIMFDPAEDYSARDLDIEPVADPRSVTKMQEMAKAQLLMDLAQAGMVDMAEAASRVIEAADIGDVEELVPQPDPMMPMVKQMELQAMQADLSQKMAEVELTIAKVEAERASAMKDVADAQREEKELRYNTVLKMLEMSRDELGQAIQRGSERMAGQPDNGGSPRGGGADLLRP